MWKTSLSRHHQLSLSRLPADTDNNQGWRWSVGRRTQSAGVIPAEWRRQAGRQEKMHGHDMTGLGKPPGLCCGAGSPSRWKGWMGPPRRRITLEGLGARPATDALRHCQTNVLGWWASRALQNEQAGSASAKQHTEKRKVKSSSVKTQHLRNSVKTHEALTSRLDLEKKAVSINTFKKIVQDSGRRGPWTGLSEEEDEKCTCGCFFCLVLVRAYG